MPENPASPEILFSNLNQAPRDIFLRPLQDLGEDNRSIGYDGIELTWVASRALIDAARGSQGVGHIRSLHEGFAFTRPWGNPAKNLALNLAWSAIMPPSTLGSYQPGAKALEYLRGTGLELPTVIYPHWKPDAAELDKQKIKRLGSTDVAMQPSAEEFELWGVEKAVDFLDEVEDRGFKICFDTFHARRISRASGEPGMSWYTWLPGALEKGLVTRVHISGYRQDFHNVDPGTVSRTDAETDLLLYHDTLTGELREIVSCLQAAQPGQIKAVVVEIPHGGAVESLERNEYLPAPNLISDLYQEAQEAARELFTP